MDKEEIRKLLKELGACVEKEHPREPYYAMRRIKIENIIMNLGQPFGAENIQKIGDLKEALTIALSLWKIAHSPIGITQEAMVEYKRRIDTLMKDLNTRSINEISHKKNNI